MKGVCKETGLAGMTCSSPACRNRKKPEAYLFTSTWTARCPTCRKRDDKCYCTESERDCYYLGLADATGRKGRGWRDTAVGLFDFGLALLPYVMVVVGIVLIIKML